MDDMLSGAAWKDAPSCSIGGTGPYIPKMLLGRFDSEEERESRRRYYQEKIRAESVRNGIAAVNMLKKEGIISEAVAEELERKVDDDHGMFLNDLLTTAFMDQMIPILCAALKA